MTILNQSADTKPTTTNPKNKYVDISDLMKPRQLSDLTLPRFIISDLKAKITTNSIDNMLFYGKSGTGKTSAANLIMSELTDWKQQSFDGRSGIGLVTFREKIAPYAKGSLTTGQHRLCFIDNANYLSKDVRYELYRLISDTHKTCRYILAANYGWRDLESPLLRPVFFNAREPRDIDVQAHVVLQYERRLSEAGVSFDQQTLIEIVGCYFPNLQDIADQAQIEFIGIKRKSNGSFRDLLQLN